MFSPLLTWDLKVKTQKYHLVLTLTFNTPHVNKASIFIKSNHPNYQSNQKIISDHLELNL